MQAPLPCGKDRNKCRMCLFLFAFDVNNTNLVHSRLLIMYLSVAFLKENFSLNKIMSVLQAVKLL